MNAKDLRIGNWITISPLGLVQQVIDCMSDSINTKYHESIPLDWIEPILLTELWMSRFGFKSVGIGGNIFEYKDSIGGDHRFVIESDGILLYPQIDFDVCCFSEFKYVHQLQNLYFAITGEELTTR